MKRFLIDPNNILNVLFHILKTAWPTKIPMPFCGPGTNYYKIHVSHFVLHETITCIEIEDMLGPCVKHSLK